MLRAFAVLTVTSLGLAWSVLAADPPTRPADQEPAQLQLVDEGRQTRSDDRQRAGGRVGLEAEMMAARREELRPRSGQRLAVLVPCFNEEAAIPKVIEPGPHPQSLRRGHSPPLPCAMRAP